MQRITLLLFLVFSINAQTPLSGNISDRTFKPSGNPFIIKENVFIKNGSKAIIKPGCIFLFKPFSGIIVQGSLVVEGLPETPVVFTSINDSTYNEASTQKPELFDWNGIVIERNAEVIKMSDFILTFSVFGIKSKKDDIVLERGIFKQNGQFNFTINDKIQKVENNFPFSYKFTGKTQNTSKDISHRWAKPVGISTIATGAVFLGAMGYFIYSSFDQNRKYENAENNSECKSFIEKRDVAVRNATITGIIGGILIPTGSGILIWEHKTENSEKNMTIYPLFGAKNGFEFVMKY